MCEMEKTAKYSPFKWVLPLRQISSSSVTHTPTAPALAWRKLPFSFWSLPSFIIFPLQCKAGKYRLCLESSSRGHVYQKPCCKPVKKKDHLQNSSLQFHSVSTRKLAAICPSLDRVLFLRLKGLPPCPTPSISVPSTAHKVIYHVLELWLSATQLRWGCEPLCFYFSCSLTSADSGWGQDPRKLRIVWLSLKLLHFLKFVPWCKGKPI